MLQFILMTFFFDYQITPEKKSLTSQPNQIPQIIFNELIVYNQMDKIKVKNSNQIKSFTKKRYSIPRQYRTKSFHLQNEFNRIVDLSVKTLDVAQHLKQTFFGIKLDKTSNYFNVKQDKMLMRKDFLNQFQRKNEVFFMPSLQVSFEKKTKDQSQLQISPKLVQKRERAVTNPSSPTKQNISIGKGERKTIKAVTLQCNSSIQLISESKPTQSQEITQKGTVKRTNTFLFNVPAKMKPKKTNTKEQKTYKWQNQLHQNLNLIQQTSFKWRQNIKVEKQKLSLYLSKAFMNQIITTYYKCEAFQNFKSMKLIVEDLMNLAQKEHNMITFFTYDVNCDGFICEEDLYFFLERLPYTQKILTDLYFIIQFLNKNKVRSTEVNLPQRLMKKRQKTIAYMLWSDNTEQKKRQPDQRHKPKKINEKLFTIFSRKDQQAQILKEKPSDKKFQINFDVFNLIFAEKKPVLIQEIIKKFIEKQIPAHKKTVKTEPIQQQSFYLDPLSQTRTQTWKKHVSHSVYLVEKAKKQREILSRKF